MPPSPGLTAQREPPPRANYFALEWFGNGALYSLNYHRALVAGLWARAGLSYVGFGTGLFGAKARAQLVTAPLMIDYVGIGTRHHKLELGAGVTILYATAELRLLARLIDGGRAVVAGTGTLGYRYLGRRGVTFSIGFTPIFGRRAFVPWGGASFGLGF